MNDKNAVKIKGEIVGERSPRGGKRQREVGGVPIGDG